MTERHAHGARFTSFELLEAAVKSFEEKQMVTYWIRDSQKACAYQKQQGDGVVLNPALVYGEVKWDCIKGKHKFTSIGNGKESIRGDNMCYYATPNG